MVWRQRRRVREKRMVNRVDLYFNVAIIIIISRGFLLPTFTSIAVHGINFQGNKIWNVSSPLFLFFILFEEHR